MLDKAIMALPPDQHALLDHLAAIKFGIFNTLSNVENVNNRHMTSTDNEYFLETVSEECQCDHICQFIDTTRNKATSMSTCAVCTCSFFDLEIDKVKVTDLQEKNILAPSKSHPAHKLTNGMLLHSTLSSMHFSHDGSLMANICILCSSNLKHNKTPALSLANMLCFSYYTVLTIQTTIGTVIITLSSLPSCTDFDHLTYFLDSVHDSYQLIFMTHTTTDTSSIHTMTSS
jgi:hypothetical protein